MKFFIISKKQIIISVASVAAVIIAVSGSLAAFAGNERKLPIYCVETNEKKIAISFDAAWGNDDTEMLIKILDEYDVPATFFVVGAWVDKYPESVKQLCDAGHKIENHSNAHPHMPQLSSQQMVAELESCNEKIASVTGETPVLFRPPYGDYDNATIEAAESLGMYTIQWDVDTIDIKVMTNEYHCAIMSIV